MRNGWRTSDNNERHSENTTTKKTKGAQMQVAIVKISKIKSQYGGEIIRLDGHHEDETGQLVKGYCFIDPKNDNWHQWVETMETAAMNRGKYILVDHIHMKNRAKGIWDADSRPQVIDIINR